MNDKIVYLPIEVPDNDYCWDGHNPCMHFDNEGGHGTCDMHIGSPDSDKEGLYRKPKLCSQLTEFTKKIKDSIPYYGS